MRRRIVSFCCLFVLALSLSCACSSSDVDSKRAAIGPRKVELPRAMERAQAEQRGLEMLRKSGLGSAVTTVTAQDHPVEPRSKWEVVADTEVRLGFDQATGRLDSVFVYGTGVQRPDRKLGPKAAFAAASEKLRVMGAEIPSAEPSRTVDVNGDESYVWQRIEHGYPVLGDRIVVRLFAKSRALSGYNWRMYSVLKGPSQPRLARQRAEEIASTRAGEGWKTASAHLAWMPEGLTKGRRTGDAVLAWVVTLERQGPDGLQQVGYFLSAEDGSVVAETHSG